MKRYFLSLACIALLVPGFSQVVNNLVVFSNEGEPFTLIMNGERYNETPQTRVRVTGLTLKQYQVKIIFKNEKLKDHDTRLTFFSTGTECEFALNPKGKKKHTMDYVSEKPMEGFGQPQTNTQTNIQPNNQNVNNTNTNTDATYTSTTTQTVTSTTVNTVITGPGMIPNGQNGNPLSVNTNDGSININVGNEQFQLFKSDIIKQVTEAAKQARALALLNNNLFSSAQVKEAMSLFSTNRGKLDFVKRAYHHTKDRENYYMIVDAFPDQASRDELQAFMQSYR